MKLYIWEGGRISDAYHDDGTLVVLASSPEEARQVIRDGVAARTASTDERQRRMQELADRLGVSFHAATGTEEGEAIDHLYPFSFDSDYFDGEDTALDREPDRIVELDGPKWVAFNGGGYD